MGRLRSLGAVVTAVALAVGMTALPAQAHTTIAIAGFQILPGGYVTGYGVAPNIQIDDGPVSDGFLVFENHDPVEHRLVECDPCGDDPQVADEPAFDVTVAPHGRAQIGIEDGTYEYFDPNYPFMRGRVSAAR